MAITAVAWGPGTLRSVWEDETQSLFVVRTFESYQQLTLAGLTNYLSSFIVFAAIDRLVIFGTIVALRLPFLLMALVGLLCIFRIGMSLGSRHLGLAMAAACATWPVLAFYSCEIRYYSPVVLFSMASILMWERYRHQPGWRLLLLALLVNGVAILTYLLAISLLCWPWIYWLGLRGRALIRVMHAERPQRRDAIHGLLTTLAQAVVLILFSGTIIWISLGPTKGAAIFGSFYAAGKAAVSTADDGHFLDVLKLKMQAIGKPAEKQSEKEEVLFQFPSIPDLLAYLHRASIEALNPARPALDLLFNVREAPGAFQGIFSYFSNGAYLAPGRWPHALGLLLLIVGSFCIARRSPLLAMGLAVTFLAWVILQTMGLRVSYRFNTRYFIYPAMIALMVAGAGVEGCARLVVWPLHHWRPRLGITSARFLLPLAVLILVLGLFGINRHVARGQMAEWQQVYKLARQRFPHGFVLHGYAERNVSLYNQLDWYGGGRNLPYWEHPLRDRFVEVYGNWGKTDEPVLDAINPYEGFLLTNYGHPDSGDPFLPLTKKYAHLLSVEPTCRVPGALYRFASLENKVFITRGHLTTPLQPRFERKPESGKTIYEIECFFEVPGPYRFGVSTTTDSLPTRITLQDQVLSTSLRPTPPREASAQLQPIANPAVHYEGSFNMPRPVPRRNHLPSHNPELAASWPADLDPVWQDGPAEGEFPINLTATTQALGSFTILTDSFAKRYKIRLEFDAPPAKSPLIRWQYNNADWRSLNEYYDAGPVISWEDDAGFYCGMPIRIRRVDRQRGNIIYQYIKQTSKIQPEFTNQRGEFFRNRDVQVGHVFWLGTMHIPRAKAASLVNLPLVYMIRPAYQNVQGQVVTEPYTTSRFFDKNWTYLASYLRFTQKQGALRMMIGEPASQVTAK